jgi:UDP-3-O-[3-hydroxymyristoyl] glucosamine N-acyltransferase
MPFTLGEIAARIGAELRGDSNIVISNLATLEEAGEGDLSYVASPKFKRLVETTKASALIAYPGLEIPRLPTLAVKNPYLGFTLAMRFFYRCFPDVPPGIATSAAVAPDVHIPPDVHIGENAVVSKGVCLGDGCVIQAGAFVGENTTLGKNCRIFANATIRENVRIGNNVVVYSNAVIGSDGFGYCWDGQRHVKIPQAGTVVIEDDVEIGAGTTIDRATLGETVIGRGTIIDNLVQIAHNCRIGEYSVICAQVGMAGTTALGRRVTLAGQVGLAGHLSIGENAVIEAQSGVASDVPPGAVYFGCPARDIRLAHKIEAILNHLPEYISRLRKIESLFKKEDGA